MKKKRLLSDFTLISLFYVLLGVILLGWPETSARIICYAFGAVIAVAGVLRVLRYFFRDKYNGMMRRDLAVGLVLVSAAAFLILRPDAVVSLLPFVFGLLLLLLAQAIFLPAAVVFLGQEIQGDWRVALGALLLVDAGGENLMNYCSDHTRTYPVSGRFTDLQREIYEIVLACQEIMNGKVTVARD